ALLAGEAAGHHERVAVGDGQVAVHHRTVEGLRPEVLPHALDQVGVDVVGLGVDRPLRVGADDLDGGVAFLEVAADAGDGAAGADPGDEGVDLAAGLLPDLRAGAAVVRGGVGLVGVLVGLEGAGDLLGEAV